MTLALYTACQQAVHVITVEGQVIKAGRAAMFVLEELGYPGWLVRPLTWPPLVWLTELGYWLVANNRPFFSRFLFTREADEG
jgi:predicted DCC family thiol-disulfide oxidoreductase YuxK